MAIKINLKELAEYMLEHYTFSIEDYHLNYFTGLHMAFIDLYTSGKLDSKKVILLPAYKQLLEDLHTMIMFLMLKKLKDLLANGEFEEQLIYEKEYETVFEDNEVY